MKPSEIIGGAINLIEDRSNWTTGQLFDYDKNANKTCMCGLGALSAAAHKITSNEGNIRLHDDFDDLENDAYCASAAEHRAAVRALAEAIMPEGYVMEPGEDMYDIVYTFNDGSNPYQPSGEPDLAAAASHERIIAKLKEVKTQLEKENR